MKGGVMGRGREVLRIKDKDTCVCYENVSRSVVSDSLQPHGLWLTDSSVHGILQARILEWVAIPFSRGIFLTQDGTQVSRTASRFFTV